MLRSWISSLSCGEEGDCGWMDVNCWLVAFAVSQNFRVAISYSSAPR